jgi:hypothetical protein
MDPNSWIYPAFFQATRDYLLYLQQLSVLLITATGILFYANKNPSRTFTVLAIVTFISGVLTLISGLLLYSSFLNSILNFIKKPSFQEIRCWINTQFILALVTTVFVGLTAYTSKAKK